MGIAQWAMGKKRGERSFMRAVQHLATLEGKNVNDLIEDALRDLLKKHKLPVPLNR